MLTPVGLLSTNCFPAGEPIRNTLTWRLLPSTATMAGAAKKRQQAARREAMVSSSSPQEPSPSQDNTTTVQRSLLSGSPPESKLDQVDVPRVISGMGLDGPSDEAPAPTTRPGFITQSNTRVELPSDAYRLFGQEVSVIVFHSLVFEPHFGTSFSLSIRTSPSFAELLPFSMDQ